MSETLWVATPADTAINSVSDITIVSQDVTTAAGDQLFVDAWGTILNDSGLSRNIVYTLDFDALLDIEFTKTHSANAANRHGWHVSAVLDLRSPSLLYAVVYLDSTGVPGVSGADSTASASDSAVKGWGTSTTDATGATTVSLRVRSDDATATQTLYLHHFSIRRESAAAAAARVPRFTPYPQLLAH